MRVHRLHLRVGRESHPVRSLDSSDRPAKCACAGRFSPLLLLLFAALVVAMVSSIAAFVQTGRRASGDDAEPGERPLVLAALANGRVLLFDIQTGAAVRGFNLLAALDSESIASVSSQRADGEIFVTVLSSAPRATRVLGVRVRDGTAREVAAIPGPITYPLVDVGARSGRLFLSSDYQEHILVLDARTGSEFARFAFSHDEAGDGRSTQ